MAKKESKKVNGLVDLGYEAPDYSEPTKPGAARKTRPVYPSFRVCDEAAARLHAELEKLGLLSGRFAAVVVLKNSMVRTNDAKAAEGEKEHELEFVVESLMPHQEEAGETEDDIINDLDELPAKVAKKKAAKQE